MRLRGQRDACAQACSEGLQRRRSSNEGALLSATRDGERAWASVREPFAVAREVCRGAIEAATPQPINACAQRGKARRGEGRGAEADRGAAWQATFTFTGRRAHLIHGGAVRGIAAIELDKRWVDDETAQAAVLWKENER